MVVRLSVDNETETLDQLMARVDETANLEFIEWEQFLQFFTRRGRLREGEQIVFQYKNLNTGDDGFDQSQSKSSILEADDDDIEAKKERLKKQLSKKLCDKQNLVPK